MGMKELILFFKADTKEAEKDVDKLGKGLKGVGTSGKVASGGMKMLGGGIKFVGTALKAAGIGLFVSLLASLTAGFSSNQKTADTFGRIMLKLKPIFDVLGDVIGFVAGILEGLIDMFNSAISWIGSLIGVTNDAGDSMANMAGDVVALRNEVKLMNAELALTQLEYQREAEIQRQLRDDTSRSIDERIAANEELGRILAEQAEEERHMAEEALRLAEMEQRMDRDNIDLQVAVIEAKTKLAEIDERITGQRSEQLTNLNSLEQERAEQQRERAEKVANELEAERKAYEDIRKEMTKNVKVEEEDLSLKGQLESAAQAYADAQEHLNSLKSADTSGNQASIQASKDLIEQKKKENEQLLQDIENMQAQDDALAEFEDAHAEQKDAVIQIYNEMYSQLGADQQDYLRRLKADQKLANADNLRQLEYAVDDIEYLRQEFIDHLSALEAGKDVRIVDEDDLAQDIETVKKYSGIFDDYFDSIKDQTEHKFDKDIESNKEKIEEALLLMEQNETNIENHQKAIENKTTAHQEKLDEAERLFIETQEKLKAQAQAIVDEFRKDEDQKEIDAIKKKYQEIIDLTEEDSIDRQELIEERDAKILEITKRDENELLDVIKKNQEQLANLNKSAEQLELEAIDTKYQVMLDKAKELGISQVEIERMKQEEIKRVEDEYILIAEQTREEANRKKIDDAMSSINSLVQIAGTGATKEIGQLEKKLDKGLITEEEFNKKKNKIEKQQRKKEKKAALLQIAIDTGRQISSAYTAALSAAAASGPAAPIITPGLVLQMLAIVFSGVAQAKGVLGEAGGGGGTGGGDLGGGTKGSRDRVSDESGELPQITFGEAGSDVPPVQAFVIESDISNAQALQNELDLQSSL